MYPPWQEMKLKQKELAKQEKREKEREEKESKAKIKEEKRKEKQDKKVASRQGIKANSVQGNVSMDDFRWLSTLPPSPFPPRLRIHTTLMRIRIQPFYFNADTDPALHFDADPDPAPLQSDGNLRPLVKRAFRSPF